MSDRIRVGVLFGGPSAEHDVSCASALGVLRALDRERYDPVAIGVTRQRCFRVVPDDRLAASLVPAAPGTPAVEDRLEVCGEEVRLVSGREPGTAEVVASEPPNDPISCLDVVFPVMHGPFGEDGVLQAMLAAIGVPYVGCGVLASAVGMDKVAMKRAFRAEGLPIVRHVHFDARTWEAHPEPSALVGGLPYPLFVKPANMGSSVGISRVVSPDEFAAAVPDGFVHDHVVIVEQGVAGRELECAVLGGRDPIASLPAEVEVAGDWLDYELKYVADEDPMIVPAVLPPQVVVEIQSLSLRAFDAVGGWGLSRVDFLYDERASRLYVNEINTMPGFTERSGYPRMWAAAGIPFQALVDRLIELAFERPGAARRGMLAGTGR